jgi:hypothetical protein
MHTVLLLSLGESQAAQSRALACRARWLPARLKKNVLFHNSSQSKVL